MLYALPPVHRHAIIIGAGVAGLAISLFLRKIGISATIYEAAEYEQIKSLDGSLQIAPNGMHVLQALGLEEKIKTHGNVSTHLTFRSQQGKLLARIPNGQAEKYGQPAVIIAKSIFHQFLMEEAYKQGVQIEFNKQLKDIFDLPGKEIVAHFEGGATASGNFLIGADGIYSRTRRLIFPESPSPRFKRLLSLSGVVPLSEVTDAWLPEKNDIVMSIGKNGSFSYGISNKERDSALTWWGSLPVPKEMSREELSALTTKELKTKLLKWYQGWHEPIGDLINHSSVIVQTNSHEMPVIPSWYKDRVVLIGNAAHATPPHAGQASAVALEDAMYLAKLFRQWPGQYEQIFYQFEKNRRSRVEKINARIRRRGNSSQTVRSPLPKGLHDFFTSFFLKTFAEKKIDWLYRYKIQWED